MFWRNVGVFKGIRCGKIDLERFRETLAYCEGYEMGSGLWCFGGTLVYCKG